ncbi:MAG TPA: hypothetical protein VIG47_02920 [Gemmatimonadaceae bacterium]|jgi:hypothetical protein
MTLGKAGIRFLKSSRRMIAVAALAACSSSSPTAPRQPLDFSYHTASVAEVQNSPRVAVTTGSGSVTVTGIVTAPNPPCATTVSAADSFSARTLTVRIITSVPGPGAGTCALALDGPSYLYAATSHNIPSGSVRVVVKYVISDGNAKTDSSATVLDQAVSVQ